MLVLLDMLTNTITGINLISFMVFFYYMKPMEFIYSTIILLLFNSNIFTLVVVVLMYVMEHLLQKYVNYNLLFRLSLITFYYVVLFKVDISYLVNILLVIIIHLYKYNNSGDYIGIKKISK